MIGFDLHTVSDIVYNGNTVNSVWFRGALIWPPNTPPPTPTDWSTEYLQVEALEPMILRNKRPTTADSSIILDIQYSVDKVNWYSWNEDISISMVTGDKVYFKGSYLPTFTAVNTNGNTKKYDLCYATNTSYTTTHYEVKGNIMSLIFGDNFSAQTSLSGYDWCFHKLFYDNDDSFDVTNLCMPATTLADYCYSEMFWSCNLLTTSPLILPATILEPYCYNAMFSYCISLTTTPTLSATTLADYCCYNMFIGCTSLTTAPALNATTLADYCYSQMFLDCTSLTTIPSILPATTLADYCYYQMFLGCTSLTTAPELPAITMVDHCYDRMFNGCSLLNYVKCLAQYQWSSPQITPYTSHWLDDVSATGTFVKDANSTYPRSGNGIPSGWTVQNI